MNPITICENLIGGEATYWVMVGIPLAVASYVCWRLVTLGHPKEDPAHKGCSRLHTSLFSDESEFVDATIILHDREQDFRPYLLVQAEGEGDVRVQYENIIKLNISDNTSHPTPCSGFGIDYKDFAGDALLLFVRPGASHSLTETQVGTIKDSYDLWAVNHGREPLVVNDESYVRPKRTLVRRAVKAV